MREELGIQTHRRGLSGQKLQEKTFMYDGSFRKKLTAQTKSMDFYLRGPLSVRRGKKIKLVI